MNHPRYSQGSRVELRKTLLFFVKLARVKMVIDVELFYGTCVSEIYCFDVLFEGTRSSAYGAYQSRHWRARYLVLTDTDGTRKEDLAGLIFRAGGKAGSSRTPWEAT